MARIVAGWSWRQAPMVFPTLLLLVVIGELYMRAFFLPSLILDPDPELGFVNRPDQWCIDWLGNASVPSPPISINADGDRGSNTDWDKTIILAVGSSEVFGLGIEDDQTWPEVLERLIREGDESDGVEVVNGGVLGYGPYQQAVSLDRVLERHAIDTAIIRVNIGDRNFGVPSGVVAKSAAREFVRSHTRFVRFLLVRAQAQMGPIRQAMVPYPLRAGGQDRDPQFRLAAEEMWEANEQYWRRAVDSAALHGTRVLFLIVNPAGLEGNSFLAQKLGELDQGLAGVDVLELGPEHFGLEEFDADERITLFNKRFTLGYDAHANAEQHRIVATALYGFLQD